MKKALITLALIATLAAGAYAAYRIQIETIEISGASQTLALTNLGPLRTTSIKVLMDDAVTNTFSWSIVRGGITNAIVSGVAVTNSYFLEINAAFKSTDAWLFENSVTNGDIDVAYTHGG